VSSDGINLERTSFQAVDFSIVLLLWEEKLFYLAGWQLAGTELSYELFALCFYSCLFLQVILDLGSVNSILHTNQLENKGVFAGSLLNEPWLENVLRLC
jgi:hypothetical protein